MRDDSATDRIRYVTSRDQIPERTRDHFDSIVETRGSVTDLFAVLLNSPELAGRIAHLGTFIRFEGELPDASRELAILTAARAFDCAYEWASHEPLARDVGVRASAIEVVAEGEDLTSLEEDETTVVAYGRELLENKEVSDSTYRSVLDRFGESGAVELTATVGYYAMLACVLNGFDVPPRTDGPRLP